jgi:serine/threonine protein kinase
MDSKGITEADVRREARMLERLRHSHIIRYYGVETSEEEIGIVMELAAGGSVADIIKERAAAGAGPEGVTRTEMREILEQMANALDYLHGQGVVHRDIKADNVLLAHAPGAGPLHIKVADFGVAAALSSTLSSLQTLASGAGTRPYFAPERENQMAYRVMADMWALGCLMLELASLRRLDRGLGRNEPEVAKRRTALLLQVACKDEELGQMTAQVLHMDQNCRLSALALKAVLSAKARQAAAAVLKAKEHAPDKLGHKVEAAKSMLQEITERERERRLALEAEVEQLRELKRKKAEDIERFRKIKDEEERKVRERQEMAQQEAQRKKELDPLILC